MSQENAWILTDVERKVWEDEFVLKAADVDGSGDGWTITKQTLRGGRSLAGPFSWRTAVA